MNINLLSKYLRKHFSLSKEYKTAPFTLVLGGGGARGLAHIGVIKSLEKANLHPSFIVGTSMGALVGAMYCQLNNANAIENKVRTFLNSKFFKSIGLEEFDNQNNNNLSIWERFIAHLRHRFFFTKSVLGTGMFAQTTLLHAMHLLLEDKDINELPVKYAAVACDLKTGEEIVFTKGSVIQAVTASSAVPGIVAPIAFNSWFLIDGTVISNIPVLAAKNISNNPIIAVDVRRSLEKYEEHRHGYEVIIRANDITNFRLNNIYLEQADVVIRPKVNDIEWNEFGKIDKCIELGEQAVEEKLSDIKMKLQKKSTSLFFKKT